MAWLAVDKNGEENLFIDKPERFYCGKNIWVLSTICDHHGYILLRKGQIETLIGKVLTWKDEPVEI
jgi:hypothetical protein